MNPEQLALAYVDRFCSADLAGLEEILDPGLELKGPLFEFRDRAAYLASLRDPPLEKARYQVLSVTSQEQEAAVFFDYEKPDQTLTVAVACGVRSGQIARMRIIFDARGFDRYG